MTVVKTDVAQANTSTVKKEKLPMEFIGKGWKHNTEAGKPFINITLDQTITAVNMVKGQRLMLWPNNKREGKNDADYRVSLIG